MQWFCIVLLCLASVAAASRIYDLETENTNLKIRVDAIEQKLGVKM